MSCSHQSHMIKSSQKSVDIGWRPDFSGLKLNIVDIVWGHLNCHDRYRYYWYTGIHWYNTGGGLEGEEVEGVLYGMIKMMEKESGDTTYNLS